MFYHRHSWNTQQNASKATINSISVILCYVVDALWSKMSIWCVTCHCTDMHIKVKCDFAFIFFLCIYESWLFVQWHYFISISTQGYWYWCLCFNWTESKMKIKTYSIHNFMNSFRMQFVSLIFPLFAAYSTSNRIHHQSTHIWKFLP